MKRILGFFGYVPKTETQQQQEPPPQQICAHRLFLLEQHMLTLQFISDLSRSHDRTMHGCTSLHNNHCVHRDGNSGDGPPVVAASSGHVATTASATATEADDVTTMPPLAPRFKQRRLAANAGAGANGSTLSPHAAAPSSAAVPASHTTAERTGGHGSATPASAVVRAVGAPPASAPPAAAPPATPAADALTLTDDAVDMGGSFDADTITHTHHLCGVDHFDLGPRGAPPPVDSTVDSSDVFFVDGHVECHVRMPDKTVFNLGWPFHHCNSYGSSTGTRHVVVLKCVGAYECPECSYRAKPPVGRARAKNGAQNSSRQNSPSIPQRLFNTDNFYIFCFTSQQNRRLSAPARAPCATSTCR